MYSRSVMRKFVESERGMLETSTPQIVYRASRVVAKDPERYTTELDEHMKLWADAGWTIVTATATTYRALAAGATQFATFFVWQNERPA